MENKSILFLPRDQRTPFSVNNNHTPSNLSKPISLEGYEALPDGTKIFIFHKKYLYKRKNQKLLIIHTKLDLRVDNNINFWIEKSKLDNDEWEINEWNALKISRIKSYVSKNYELKPKKQTMNIKKELKLDTKELPEYSELKTTIQTQQQQIESLQKEILELKHEKEFQQLRLELQMSEKEKTWMIEKIKIFENKKDSKKIPLNENDPVRIKACCRETRFKILESITDNGKLINVYEIKYGPQGTAFGSRTIICRTKHQLAIGYEIRFNMLVDMRDDDIWEISDKKHKIAVTPDKNSIQE